MASRPSRSRMTAAWMNADDMVAALSVAFGWFYPPRSPSKAALPQAESSRPACMQKSSANKQLLDCRAKLESFNSVGLPRRQTQLLDLFRLPRAESLGLQYRQ